MPSIATATAFLSTFGVNTHSGHAGYANASIVNNSLAYLGFSRVRDNLPTLGTASAVTNAMAAAGVKFDVLISSAMPAAGDAALAEHVKAIEAFAAKYKGSVIAVEGLNEANIQAFSYQGSSSLAAAGAFQKALYGAVKGNAGLAGIPVINMSLGMESDADAAALGDLGAYSDFANAHAYTATGQQADKVMEASLARAQRTSRGDPAVITETGYTTMASNPDLGVNQSAQAKLTLNAMLLAFENGSQQTYLYELLDSNLAPDGPQKEKHFGLFNTDGTPKLAATAIHNLTTILGHVDAGNGTDASKAKYTLGNLPGDGHSMVLTKASGAWDLVVWRDVKVWNDPLDKENVTEAKTVTVDLGGVQKTVYVYDPLGGTKPIAVYTNVSSIQLAVGDRPLIVEVGAAGPVVDLPPVSAPDLTMTAAQFAAQIDTLARSSGLKSVTLTDGKVIELASDATKDYVVRNYGALLGKIAGGGISFVVRETGANWRQDRTFDAAGLLTSTTDLAFDGGVLKHSRTTTTGGDVTDTVYSGGKLSQVVAMSNGRTVTTTYDVTTGKVAELVEKSANGDVAVSSYTRGILSGYTLNRADGSRTIDEFDAAGVRTREVTVDAAGTWTTSIYTAGVVKSRYVQRSDGSGENVSYGITGQPYVTMRQVTDARGVVTLVERSRADGTLVSSEAVAADGAKTTTTYGTAGNRLNAVIAGADGSRTTLTYDATSGKLVQSIVQAGGDTVTTSYTGGIVTQLSTVRADGSRDTISYDAQGRKTSDVEVTATRTWITQQFDAASGKLTRRFVQNPDGSGENVSYGITGQPYVTMRQVTDARGVVTLVERSRADGTLVSSEAVAADGAKTITTYGTAGNRLSEVIAGADGSRTTRTWDGSSGKLVQSIVQAAGETLTTTFTGGVVTQVLTVRADGSRDTVSYDTQGRKTTEVSVSAAKTWTTIQFDVATGNPTRSFIQNADGSGDNTSYGITGKSYVTLRQVTDTRGKVVEVFRTHADGTLDYHERNDPDGAREISNFDATGLKLNQLNVHADGTRVMMTFTPDTQTLAQKQTQTAAGDFIDATFVDGIMTAQKTVFADGRRVNEAVVSGTRQIDTFAADGKRISAVTVDSANTWTTLIYDAAGKPSRRYVERADHSGEVTVYGITGKSYVTETQVVDTAGKVVAVTRLHGDGSLDYTEANAADGSSVLTYYDATGRKTLHAAISANGDRFTTRFDAKSGGIVDTIAESATAKVQSVYKAGRVETRVTSDLTNGDRIVETFDAQGRMLTKATADAGGNWETLRYDATSGAVSRRFVEYADGSGQNFSYTGTGTSLITEWQKYDSAKQAVAGGQTRADGTRIAGFTVAADGTRTSEWFDAADRRQSQVTAATNGTKTSLYFDPGTQLLVKSVVQSPAGDTITASYRNGVVTDRTTQMANGAKMTESFSANGHDLSGVRALPGYQAFLFDNGSGKIAGTLADEVLLADGGGTTILTGGLGKDRFVIQRGASATITDFGAGHDLLDLSALTKGGQPTITLSEGNTVMRFGSGETVTLAGVDPGRLVASPQASGVYMLG